MIIALPNEFSMLSKTRRQGAVIENGVLKITREISFRKVMYEIAFKMKGRKKCCYCNEIISEEQMTIDHMYPQEFGGPTITNNLLPSCKKCNNEKGNLNTRQYKQYLKAKREGRKKEFITDIEAVQNYFRKWEEFAIPKEWLSKKSISEIIVVIDLEDNYSSKKYNKIVEYYKRYHHFQKPIIVDRNGFLLDGFITILYAKNNNIKDIPVIQLDNVEMIL